MFIRHAQVKIRAKRTSLRVKTGFGLGEAFIIRANLTDLRQLKNTVVPFFKSNPITFDHE